ncbi:arsenical pump-driving ATPase [Paenibacillus sp. OSY-SE]|uniref:arsenical pump-driving ATPase n=1 Tax=Paenibacillus sp. OSY-SE TaxID=1196323 RepID=UPI0003048FA5|nr:arsenical pump-driving ATPase [Paenibacillus sp. OSY-SE]
MKYVPTDLHHRYIFFTGKGGVGKTSVACSTAIALANRGKKVLLISTDPASNLDDLFETKIHSEPMPISGVSGLYAANLDPEQAAREYRDQVVGPYRDILPQEAIQQIEEQLSGACTVEIAAFDEFTKLLSANENEYDHIVFDTAPTGHTLRLLQLPKAWTGFMDTNIHGASCLGPLSGLSAKQEMYAKTVEALSDSSQTILILVARPERTALQEAARASVELQELSITNQHLIINGVLRRQTDDPNAQAFSDRQEAALANMPSGLNSLPQYEVSLKPYSVTGLNLLQEFLDPNKDTVLNHNTEQVEELSLQNLSSLLDSLTTKPSGVIMTMGKGGVGKTTVAASLAIGLASRGHRVHLTTTDPAAHLSLALGDDIEEKYPLLQVSRIDPKLETTRYSSEIIGMNVDHLDQDGLELLKEDLASPCTEEIAVFRAFARIVEEADHGFVVMDTAPTGHTLLLLDAAEAYHREVQRSTGNIPESVRNLLPRLRNPEETHVVIVTLPEATPVMEAERLQKDLQRAEIEPDWWVVNQSWQDIKTTEPVLQNRALAENKWIQKVTVLSKHTALVPWKANEPTGWRQLEILTQH